MSVVDQGDDARTASAPGPGHRRGRRGRIAAVVSVLGELLITTGVLLGLFVVYSLWWTNVLANREAERDSAEVRENWAQDGPGGAAEDRTYDAGEGVGFLHVPSMGGEVLIKKGTDTDELNKGVAGYYTEPVKAVPPWKGEGNFSLAAHRDGHGAKFHDIHRMEKGDPVVVETEDTWYVYKVYEILPKTSKYNVEVLAGVPEVSGRDEPGRYITLTTCTPILTSDYRYIVWGELVRTEKVDAERTPPAEIR
ncbi:class E sortase [Streptomyces carminius]|uniref:Class E sortase n=1 Tax=Streptomyces carminius TaxID=2665496 RepID=A0A2M8MBY6_9ACTN|nr:class E sortase [Streptomyces carminius]PJF01646.1 class E sortase [Streptomyces carminius]